MDRNLFKIGEVVIVQSVTMPEENGEYLVVDFYWHEIGSCYATGELLPPGFAYKLDSSHIEWDESALRKKYPPADESFKDMMQNIKSNVRVSEGVV